MKMMPTGGSLRRGARQLNWVDTQKFNHKHGYCGPVSSTGVIPGG